MSRNHCIRRKEAGLVYRFSTHVADVLEIETVESFTKHCLPHHDYAITKTCKSVSRIINVVIV